MKYRILVIFLGLTMSLLAQKTIEIQVVNGKTNKVMPDVLLTFSFEKQANYFILSDENGRAKVSWNGKGKYMLVTAEDENKRFFFLDKYYDRDELKSLSTISVIMYEMGDYSAYLQKYVKRDAEIDVQLRESGADTLVYDEEQKEACSNFIESEFSGGSMWMQKWISENVAYPQRSIEENEQGKVYLAFIVEANGVVSHVKIDKSVSPYLDLEAARLINRMPLWIPATCDGVKVRSIARLPINFTLN